MSNAGEKLWTKDFIIMSIINFVIMIIFYLLMVTMASYAVKQFHASVSQAGLVAGIYIVGTLLGRIVTGRIINKVGTKKIFNDWSNSISYNNVIIFYSSGDYRIDH